MKLRTKVNITPEQWQEQASRFSKITDQVNKLTFPKTDVTNLHAEIEMNVVQPLTKGFKGHVTYTQFFEVPIGETTTTKSHVVVDYYEIIPRDLANVMIDLIKDKAPSDLTAYLDIQDWIIKESFLNQVVSKNTFGGLQKSDYELIK